jgi:hypothetical protein
MGGCWTTNLFQVNPRDIYVTPELRYRGNNVSDDYGS